MPRVNRTEMCASEEVHVALVFLVHTIYHAMGIHDLEAIDNQNRPYNLLSEGNPLIELF